MQRSRLENRMAGKSSDVKMLKDFFQVLTGNTLLLNYSQNSTTTAKITIKNLSYRIESKLIHKKTTGFGQFLNIDLITRIRYAIIYLSLLVSL